MVTITRVVDQRWRKLPALILLGFHTGLRVGNLMELKWRDVDLEAGTLAVAITKNGRPYVAPLTNRCTKELKEWGDRHKLFGDK